MRYSFYALFFVFSTIVVSCSNPQKTSSAETASTQKQAIDTADMRLARDFSVFFSTQINSSELAETKASSQKVKDFAKQTKELYERLGDRLNNISDDYEVKLPAELTPTAMAQIKDLKDIKGASFDHIYLLEMLKQHNIMIREFNAAKNIQCAPLKLFSISSQSDIIKTAYATSALKDKTPD